MRAAPDYIQFYPTLRCTLSCAFCFNRGMPSMPDISAQQFSLLLAKLRTLSIKTLDIMGGEPTLHPDIVRFIQGAERQGLRVNISSNGTNVEMLKKILNTSNSGTVGISVHDRDMLNHLKAFILEHHPDVKTIFSKTLDLVLVTEILMLKPKHFTLIYRDVMVPDELDESVPFYRFMSAAQQQQYRASGIDTVFCSGFLPDTEQYPELASVRCPAGTTKLGVMPDGSVYPCNLFFGKKEFLLGNILTDPFESIWNQMVLTFFRTFISNTCPHKNCELHSQCHGGCPAQAFFLLGDLSAPDPRCVRS
ncbi:MAG: radical SAM protein [Nitrospirota bacterium]